MRSSSVKDKVRIIERLRKHVNLWDSEEVENYIQDASVCNGRKNLIGYTYQQWAEFHGFEYKPRKYQYERKFPYIPTEQEVD